MNLWIECAHQSLAGSEGQACGDAIRTFQTEEQFFAVVVSGARGGPGGAAAVAQRAAGLLEQGEPVSAVKEALLAQREQAPFSILQARRPALQAHLVECDAPPLFFTRGGQLVLPPIIEEEARGRLVREGTFPLQDGDYVAMVSEGYICARGWDQCWGWRDIAASIKRLTDTRCDAEQLLGALVRTYQRLAAGERRDVSVVAMFVRPMRTATVWSGPPVRRALEEVMLKKLMAETGARIICGDTSAEIAARLLGSRLEMEARPEDGWAEVPPVSRLAGVDLVTEGVVTMSKARERLASARRARDLPRKEDGATRLAKMLLTADKIHFLVGLAINPAQTVGGAPMRQIVVEELMRDLKARGKMISVEYFESKPEEGGVN